MIFIPLCKSGPGSGNGKGQDRARKAAEPVCKEETGFFFKKKALLYAALLMFFRAFLLHSIIT